MDAQASQGPAITRVKPEAVKVTAVDANMALPWDKMFDGPPLVPWPKWIEAALVIQDVWPHTRGGTDYAQWDVKTPSGKKNAKPGDWIIRRRNGDLDVCEQEHAEAVINAALKIASGGAI